MFYILIGRLCYSYVIYGHEKPWCNDTDRGKLLICPPELSGNATSSHLIAKQEEHKGSDKFDLTKHLCSYFEGIF
jgi:hypothetical protein